MDVLIFIIIVFVLIVAFLKYEVPLQTETRGEHGENRVKRVIGKTIENEQYVINDLIIEKDGMTSQIDHVVINSHGIFVIETKNYSGRIYGKEGQQEWTQVLAYGNKKSKFYNPLKQNATHVYNVKRIVGNLPIRSLVVFVQNNTAYIDADNVISVTRLKAALTCGENVLSIEQMKKAYETLLSSRMEISTQEHVYNIIKQKQNLERGICPRCGGDLVLRNGKYGDFVGCSNFPKCRFIKK